MFYVAGAILVTGMFWILLRPNCCKDTTNFKYCQINFNYFRSNYKILILVKLCAIYSVKQCICAFWSIFCANCEINSLLSYLIRPQLCCIALFMILKLLFVYIKIVISCNYHLSRGFVSLNPFVLAGMRSIRCN